MGKDRKTGTVFVCPEALVRKLLHEWAPGQQKGSGEHGGPSCLRALEVFSLKQTTGTKKET